jgi:DNA mismatch repair protein MutL
MNKIQVLPEILANKIAAGEIVERPASAVKELLENSIDAQSRTIYVSVSSGGKRSILIRDDGEGMSQDDALLAFEHHATSKLRSAEDLSSIATLGFRGEALPSIASVSRLILKTRTEGATSISGTEIEINGGVMHSVKSISWDKGTEIEIRGLFYNVPARKKFLRSDDTELGHIARLVTHYALAHPEIRFTLESEGRTLLDAVAVTDIKERIYQIFGDGFLDSLIEFRGQTGSVKVHGFGSRPQDQRTNSYSQYIYVNQRMVRDKVLMGAIRQAYRSYIPSSSYPIVILFLELPFDEVDVNAHPAKTEIRFQDQNTIHRLTFGTIDRALKERVSISDFVHKQELNSFPNSMAFAPYPNSSYAMPVRQQEGFQLTQPVVGSNPSQQALDYPFREVFSPGALANMDHQSMNLMPEMLLGSPREIRGGFQSKGVRILGQLHDSYIIACDAEGLLIVDQHVAHERILYENFAAAMLNNKVETQGLLIPISWELPPHQLALLNRITPELVQNGFNIEPFGGSSVIIRSVPAIAKDSDCQSLLLEILEGMETEERSLDVQKIRDKIAVKTACKAAVKVNMSLSMEKMQWLLDQLEQTQIPTNCPHGRPIILRFSMYEIQRNFGRT